MSSRPPPDLWQPCFGNGPNGPTPTESCGSGGCDSPCRHTSQTRLDCHRANLSQRGRTIGSGSVKDRTSRPYQAESATWHLAATAELSRGRGRRIFLNSLNAATYSPEQCSADFSRLSQWNSQPAAPNAMAARARLVQVGTLRGLRQRGWAARGWQCRPAIRGSSRTRRVS